MKYGINKTNFNDFSVYEINKLEGRGYSIPYSSKEALSKTPFKKERNSSDIVRVLRANGILNITTATQNSPPSSTPIQLNSIRSRCPQPGRESAMTALHI